jgi:small subunit ribosomal protein S15
VWGVRVFWLVKALFGLLALTKLSSFGIVALFFIYPLNIKGSNPLGHAPEWLVNHNACMLTKRKKQNVIKKYQTRDGDTGSSQVQIAILTSEIAELVSHLKKHHKDHSSRRGLLRKVGERRRLLRYLKKEDNAAYESIVKSLKLKQAKKLLKPAAPVTPIDDTDDKDNAKQ